VEGDELLRAVAVEALAPEPLRERRDHVGDPPLLRRPRRVVEQGADALLVRAPVAAQEPPRDEDGDGGEDRRGYEGAARQASK
jgi:hypothetical protein